MKRIFAIVAALAIEAPLGGLASQASPAARTLFAWVPLSRLETSTQAEPVAVKDAPPPADSKGVADAPPEGVINISSEQIDAQEIKVAPVEKGIIARRLSVPGTITLDMDLVARVPGRVVGTVTQMRKRLGDPVRQGEVVAVLDSREVADAKSEYLTAAVAFDLRKTMFERAEILWGKKISAEQQYLQARATYLEAELRLDLARQKLSALKLDPAEVEKAAKQESNLKSGVSSLREYEIRSLISGRVIERKVDVGTLIGSQGDPPDLYTVADLSMVWVEIALATTDLDVIAEGQTVVITSGRASGARGVGQIIFISPLVDPDTRSARVIAQIDNKESIWRPGSTVTASIVIKEEPVEVLVPRAALQTIGGEQVVFVRTPNGFQRRVVTTGRSDEQNVEITSGLSAGEQIAVNNTFLLKAELGKGE
ncbi:Cation transporter [Methylocella tundrae]|uniref:Cation transporter n=1 Tax=Methylocella tundrae TaxID=227605 RepID=A0A8B6MAL1_METTU|nr:efflux RND transporter periplasmic adaptor subunit [Methylocella tundrae]VTZ22392.1 Cation transporter [Methylocella tundrae]VTZ51954.1 Cation transporter [Methylocella tundrae]